MAANAVFLKVEADGITQTLREFLVELPGVRNEAVLDLSSIQRLDAKHLEIMKDIAATAEAKRLKVILCGVNVKIYKVLKLARLTQRFVIVAAETVTAK
jgi:anti-anti-sigma regulatory factor